MPSGRGSSPRRAGNNKDTPPHHMAILLGRVRGEKGKPRKPKELSIVTTNCTAWSSFKAEFESGSWLRTGDVIMIQEHGLHDNDAITSAMKWCTKQGYTAAF